MSVANYTTKNFHFASWIWINKEEVNFEAETASSLTQPPKKFDLLQPLRQRIDQIEVRDRDLAHHICKAIPAQCPFARDIKLFGKVWFRIPPMCKINPLYEEVVALRFRALCYLADECGEDITAYC